MTEFLSACVIFFIMFHAERSSRSRLYILLLLVDWIVRLKCKNLRNVAALKGTLKIMTDIRILLLVSKRFEVFQYCAMSRCRWYLRSLRKLRDCGIVIISSTRYEKYSVIQTAIITIRRRNDYCEDSNIEKLENSWRCLINNKQLYNKSNSVNNNRKNRRK